LGKMAQVFRVPGWWPRASYGAVLGLGTGGGWAFGRPCRDAWRLHGAARVRARLRGRPRRGGKRGARAGGCGGCRGAGTGERGCQVTQGERGRGRGRKEKRERAVAAPVATRERRRRGAERREPGEGAGERKGKADGWVPPVSCPGRRKRERAKCFAVWAGPAHVGWFARGERREKADGLGLRGLVAHGGI
jgi:hypothetical protein